MKIHTQWSSITNVYKVGLYSYIINDTNDICIGTMSFKKIDSIDSLIDIDYSSLELDLYSGVITSHINLLSDKIGKVILFKPVLIDAGTSNMSEVIPLMAKSFIISSNFVLAATNDMILESRLLRNLFNDSSLNLIKLYSSVSLLTA